MKKHIAAAAFLSALLLCSCGDTTAPAAPASTTAAPAAETKQISETKAADTETGSPEAPAESTVSETAEEINVSETETSAETEA